jgi:hypothetical protein
MRKAIVFNEYVKYQHRIIIDEDQGAENNEVNEAIVEAECCDHMDDVCNEFQKALGDKFITIERDFSEEIDSIEYDDEYYVDEYGNRLKC